MRFKTPLLDPVLSYPLIPVGNMGVARLYEIESIHAPVVVFGIDDEYSMNIVVPFGKVRE